MSPPLRRAYRIQRRRIDSHLGRASSTARWYVIDLPARTMEHAIRTMDLHSWRNPNYEFRIIEAMIPADDDIFD